jgi:Zn-dependent peptidase ImmA (M78 family)/DNA-binding XRE family transcriptional regulator
MTRLAREIGVDLRSISAYEKGEFRPDEERLKRISQVLRYPASFFFQDSLDELSPDAASFRALSSMTAAKRDAALGAGVIALLINDYLEQRFELPEPDLPALSREGSPEAAALALRRAWGLGELPIKNVVHLLESRGIRVFSLSQDTLSVDAFSMWRCERPFVFLNTKKSAEHSRFDAAHELGHLILHRHGAPQGQEAEREANSFASAFLMPRASLLSRQLRFPTVDTLVSLKKHWNVSVAALAYRLHSVEMITDWQYRSLYIEISKRGYRKKEPDESPRETSQILTKAFAALRDEGVSKTDMANALHITREEIEQIVFGLAVTSLSGTGERFNSRPLKPRLKVVGAND